MSVFRLVPVADCPALFNFTKAERCVVDHLIVNGASDVDHVKSAAPTVGLNPETVRKAVFVLVRKGVVHRADKGGPGAKGTYELTELGKKLSL